MGYDLIMAGQLIDLESDFLYAQDFAGVDHALGSPSSVSPFETSSCAVALMEDEDEEPDDAPEDDEEFEDDEDFDDEDFDDEDFLDDDEEDEDYDEDLSVGDDDDDY